MGSGDHLVLAEKELEDGGGTQELQFLPEQPSQLDLNEEFVPGTTCESTPARK